jgi:hypothetical protein
MPLVGLVVLLIVLIPVLVVSAFAAAAVATIVAHVLDTGRALRGARVAARAEQRLPARVSAAPVVEAEPVS